VKRGNIGDDANSLIAILEFCMLTASPFITFEKSAEETILRTIQQLEKVGFQVTRTFDLQDAKSAHPDCSCPHHGGDACDCQMSVLLIYRNGQSPASLLLHSFQGTTCLYLVDTPEQPVSNELGRLIRGILIQLIPIESNT
jgi:hypothetical protein